MGLISFIFLIAILGFIITMITKFVPMPEPFKVGIYGLCAIVICIALMQVLGIGDFHLGNMNAGILK